MDTSIAMPSNIQLGIHAAAIPLIIMLVKIVQVNTPDSWNRWLPLFVIMLSFAYASFFYHAEGTTSLMNPAVLGIAIATSAIASYSA